MKKIYTKKPREKAPVRSILSRYYGGKARLSKKIVELLNFDHSKERYIEPFTGGGSTFFALQPRKGGGYVLNDRDERIVNLYRQCQTKPKAFIKLCNERSILSRSLFNESFEILSAPGPKNTMLHAWAIWYNISNAFSGQIGKGMSISKENHKTKVDYLKSRLNKIPEQMQLLSYAFVESKDAVKLIKSYASNKKNVFYCDPPYLADAHQGHYSGYTDEEYANLLEALSNIKGRFILSSYNCKQTKAAVKNHKWKQILVPQVNMTRKIVEGKRSVDVESLVMNF